MTQFIYLLALLVIASSTLYPPTAPQISLNGRYYLDEKSIKYDWACFRISFCFKNATKVVWNVKDSWNIYNIIIDQNVTIKIHPKKDTKITLFEAKSSQSHCIQIIKITQNHYGPLGSYTDSVFNGIDVSGGTLTADPHKYNYRFDFLGDSLTTAFGDLSGRNPICLFRMKQIQNCSESWANHLSKKFNANHRIMAYSGKGVLQNSYVAAFGPKMGDLYTRATDNSKPYSYKYQDGVIPDVIYVFIGRNDYSRIKPPNSHDFVSAYIQMLMVVLREVLVAAPQKRPLIVNVCDSEFSKELCENIKTAIKEVSYSYKYIYYVQIPEGTLPKRYIGCINHPNVKGQRAIADSLYLQIKQIIQNNLRARLFK